MVRNFKKILLTIAATSLLAAPAFVPVVAYAANNPNLDIPGSACGGVDAQTSSQTDCGTGNGSGNKVATLFADIINLFSLLVGIVSVIMIIIGGFQFVTANGDSGKIGTARTTIIYALVGLVVVLMSQFIVHFVLGKLSGAIQ